MLVTLLLLDITMTATCRPLSLAFRQTKKRHLGKSSLVSQPKLFGGGIEEYVQVNLLWLFSFEVQGIVHSSTLTYTTVVLAE